MTKVDEQVFLVAREFVRLVKMLVKTILEKRSEEPLEEDAPYIGVHRRYP